MKRACFAIAFSSLAFLPLCGSAGAEAAAQPSGASGILGAAVLAFIALALGVFLLVSLLVLLLRWRKSGALGKFLLSGCSLLLFALFLLSAAGAALAFFYMEKDGASIVEKSEQSSSGDPASALEEEYLRMKEEMRSSAQARAPSEEEIARSAFDRFNGAIKLYQDYQGDFDPGTYQRALGEIEAAIDMDPGNPAYWLLAGKMYSEIAPDYEMQIQAETCLRKSLELDPKNIQAILTLANCLSLQERYHEAGELFTRALSRDYHALRDYLVPIITYTYIYDLQYEKAERFLRNLLDSDPGSEVIRISLAVAMNMQGDQKAQDAKTELRKVIAKADSPQILKTYASHLLDNFDKWHDRRNRE